MTAYFGICVGVHSLVGCHVELWIEHVLDQTAELDQAVGLQVVQRDVVQRWHLWRQRRRLFRVMFLTNNLQEFHWTPLLRFERLSVSACP